MAKLVRGNIGVTPQHAVPRSCPLHHYSTQLLTTSTSSHDACTGERVQWVGTHHIAALTPVAH